MTVTIYDVAREAKVSMATVSRVVNNNPNVKAATRQRVMDVIERLGYTPNAVARGLASKKTTTVGVIIPDISNFFNAELARGIEDIARMFKYNVMLTNSDQDSDNELEIYQTLVSKQVDGIVYLGGALSPKLTQLFTNGTIPVVLAATSDSEKVLPSVNIDYQAAAKEATLKLINNGNRKIALAIDSNKNVVCQQILAGYKDALMDKNIKFNQKYVYDTCHTYNDGIEVYPTLAKAGVDAAVVLNDEVALAFVHSVQDNNRSVPEDFEVISFNNTKLVNMVRPKVSSVAQPIYDIGAVSMRLLTKLIDKEKLEKLEGSKISQDEENHVILPFTIRYRNSTK